MTQTKSFFKRHQTPLKLAAATYVTALVLSHATLPHTHVWVLATVFSVTMNFTYLTEAVVAGRFVRVESLVMVVLVGATVIGLLTTPVLIIAAVFGHAIWDLAKHHGAGVPFFSWYTWSCAIVDLIYGSALLLYFLA